MLLGRPGPVRPVPFKLKGRASPESRQFVSGTVRPKIKSGRPLARFGPKNVGMATLHPYIHIQCNLTILTALN